MTRMRHDRLIAALIAKLPADNGHWTREDRIAWLKMMAMAFDVVYGPCGGVRIAPPETEKVEKAGVQAGAGPICSGPPGSTELARDGTPPRYFVDPDGFAMADGRPITTDDLPAGATMWDERSGAECGDPAMILWRDIGTTRRGLPAGVTLRPASQAG
jgi:hypothetical protein